MKRYLKALLGGLLAVLAAFGWLVAIAFLIEWRAGRLQGIYGFRMDHGPWALACWFLVFSAGFYLAFRAAYTKNSN